MASLFKFLNYTLTLQSAKMASSRKIIYTLCFSLSWRMLLPHPEAYIWRNFKKALQSYLCFFLFSLTPFIMCYFGEMCISKSLMKICCWWDILNTPYFLIWVLWFQHSDNMLSVCLSSSCMLTLNKLWLRSSNFF